MTLLRLLCFSPRLRIQGTIFWPITPKNWNLKANVYCYSLRGFLVMTSIQYCAPTEDWIVFSAYWVLLMCRTSMKLYVICLLKSTWFNELFKRGNCPISYFTALNLANCLPIHFPVSFMSRLTREEDQVNISWWSLSSGLQAFKQNFLVWQKNKKWIPWWSEKICSDRTFENVSKSQNLSSHPRIT